MQKYIFHVDATPKQRPRLGKHRIYTPSKTRNYETTIKHFAKLQHKGELFSGPLKVKVVFYVKRPKSVKRKYPAVKADIDNLIKSLFDGLNDAVWVDDALVVSLLCNKFYSEGKGYIEVEISELK